MELRSSIAVAVVAAAPIRPVAWERPCAVGGALKRPKKKKKKRKESKQEKKDKAIVLKYRSFPGMWFSHGGETPPINTHRPLAGNVAGILL